MMYFSGEQRVALDTLNSSTHLMYVSVFVNCFFSIFIQYAYFDPSDSLYKPKPGALCNGTIWERFKDYN